MIAIEDIIVRLQPYSQGLKNFISKHKDFATAMKVNNPSRFVSLGAVVVSRSPLVLEDKIIGFYVYDYIQEKYKQDFIVDLDGEDKEFVLYTRFKEVKKSKWIKDINSFLEKYGKNRYYLEAHHPSFDDLPEEIKPRARVAVSLANRLKKTGLRKLSRDELARFDLELRRLGL